MKKTQKEVYNKKDIKKVKRSIWDIMSRMVHYERIYRKLELKLYDLKKQLEKLVSGNI